MSTQQYWNNIYRTKDTEEVSWFQPYPTTSMSFVQMFHLPLAANIIDVGGGDSLLVDALLEKGYQNIWVLDISETAIEKAKKRLGQKAHGVHWIVADVTEFAPPVQFDFWHDRAAFHFLTTEEKIYQYVSVAEDAIRNNGYLVLGTFSENGPQKCSGLEVKQYSQASMSARFEVAFNRIKCVEEAHVTPFQTAQNFLFCSFKKKHA